MAVVQKATDTMNLLSLQPANVVKSGNKNVDFQKVMETTNISDKTTGEKQTNQKDENLIKTAGSADKIMRDKLAAINKKSAVTEDGMPTEDVLSSVQVLLQNIKELIQDAFQVTEQELSTIMDTMEITDMDLLNPQVISDLAVQINGTEDPLELLFQPEFTETLKELQNNIAAAKEELFSQIHMTEKEVVNVVEKMGEEEVPEEKSLSVKTDDKETEQTPIENVPKDIQTEKPDSKEKGMSFETKDHKDSAQPQQTLAGNIINNLEQAITEVMPEVDAAKIVKQVITEMQVSIKADTTSFEMQLNPEHLGKINLQVASKNGVVTAQIATETAMAKEALESQLVTLKETLNQQGVKVEAVEVVIATHEFERNLDSQTNGEKDSQESGNKQHRKIDFDMLQASEEELTPAEAIIKEMMLANGSKINYMA